jgi:F-type H+-transporting ATPase subunit b
MKKVLLTLLSITPLVLFANDTEVHTDIVERSVNFFIFAAILYYLLADKLKTFFGDRTKSIQAELDKAQEMMKESQKRVEEAQKEVEKSKAIAQELVASANNDVEAIKNKINDAVEQEIKILEKLSIQKQDIETKEVKQEVVRKVLNQLLSDENIALSQDDLANIILKKVA